VDVGGDEDGVLDAFVLDERQQFGAFAGIALVTIAGGGEAEILRWLGDMHEFPGDAVRLRLLQVSHGLIELDATEHGAVLHRRFGKKACRVRARSVPRREFHIAEGARVGNDD